MRVTHHWVSAPESRPATVRLYDHLFTKRDPNDVEEGAACRDHLNPSSVEVLTECRVEPGLAGAEPGSRYQFERQGYFCVDTVDSAEGKPVFNRTVSLRDSWARIEQAQKRKTQ